MSRSLKKLIILSATVVLVAAACNKQAPVSNTQNQQAVFGTQQDCEKTTGKSCAFQNCDYVPGGKTPEETCGKDFKKGWVVKSSSSDETANWKIYTNTKYGYEIKYPEKWGIESSPEDIHISSVKDTSNARQPFTTIEIQPGLKKPANISLLEYLRSANKNNDGIGAGAVYSNITFNGYKAVKSSVNGGEGPAGPGYIIEVNSTTYVSIAVYLGSAEPETDQVLSSFRLIK